MDEYFCPNCGAILNDQSGFDPSYGVWTCTECGQGLMDDDIYYGNKFTGIVWYCDECNALLNKQEGFSDSFGVWICTECGHANGTTEDDIINNDKKHLCPECGSDLEDQWCFNEYEDDWTCTSCGAHLHHNYSSEEYSVVEDEKEEQRFECPNCGDSLADQWRFNEYEDDWTCTSCGAHLHHNYSSEEYSVVEDEKEEQRFECPNCGDSLADQWDFDESEDDWTCTSCGAYLHRYACDDEYSVVEDEEEKRRFECPNCGAALAFQMCYSKYEDDWTCTSCGAHLHRDSCFDEFCIVEEDNCEEEDCEKDYFGKNSDASHSNSNCDSSKAKTCRNTWLGIEQKLPDRELRKKRIKAFFFKRKRIEIGYDYKEFLRADYEAVCIALHNRGFNNIKTIAVKDIYVGSKLDVGEVEKVTVGDRDSFIASDEIKYDTEIIITYHEKKEIEVPFSSRLLHKKDHIEVFGLLKALGFTEVYELAIKDLTTGWIKRDGSVEKVTIGGNDSFKKNTIHQYDVKIVIEYHTFRKERHGKGEK